MPHSHCSPVECPVKQPDLGSSCSLPETTRCEYGEECCCGRCHPRWREIMCRMTFSFNMMTYILKVSPTTPTGPQKNLNFPQICPNMPRNGPKMAKNDPKCPKVAQIWPQMAQIWRPDIRTFSAIFFYLKSGSANFFAFRMYAPPPVYELISQEIFYKYERWLP